MNFGVRFWVNVVDGCICILEVVGFVESGFEMILLYGFFGSVLFEIVFLRILVVGFSFGWWCLYLVMYVFGIYGVLYWVIRC